MRFTIFISLLAAALGLAACGSSSPSGTATNASAGSSEASSSKTLEFASCMRSHGVPNFADPKMQTGPFGGVPFSVDFGAKEHGNSTYTGGRLTYDPARESQRQRRR